MEFYDILKAAKSDIAPDIFTFLTARGLFGRSGAVKKELTGEPPFTIIGDGTPLLNWQIFGSETGAGDYDETSGKYIIPVVSRYLTSVDLTAPYKIGFYLDLSSGQERPNSDYNIFGSYPVVPGKSYTVAASSSSALLIIAFYDEDMRYISGIRHGPKYDVSYTFTTPENARYMYLCLNKNQIKGVKIQLNDQLRTEIILDAPLGEGETVSMEDTGIQIPTFAGSTVIDIDADQKPSGMYIKYREG